MEIYLIRHTTPAIEPGICYGQSDIDVTSTFEEEADATSSLLKQKLDIAFTSPSKRCTVLAQKLSEKTQTDTRLKELNFGEWENKSWDNIPQTKIDHWMGNYVENRPPKGESYQELKKRVTEVFKGIISQNRKATAIVTHAGPIRAILSFILNIPLEDTFKLKIDFGGITKITYSQTRFTIDYINKHE